MSDMDVDAPTPHPPISRDISQSSLMSSLPPVSQALVDEFKTQMMRASKREHWSRRLIRAGSDNEELQEVFFSVLLNYWWIVSQTALQKNVIDLSGSQSIDEFIDGLNDDEVEEWKSIVQKGDWVGLITYPKLQKPAGDRSVYTRANGILYDNKRLGKAYAQHFVGDSATKFIKHLEQADIEQETNKEKPLYAKAISVVQGSGTGKSRMLTEVGKQIFTLPICLRQSNDPGYPPGDKSVVKFFSALPGNSDTNAHTAIACFLAAAHQTMLETLQEAHKKGLNGPHLLRYWHRLMEPTGPRDRREKFFTKVVEQADSLMKLAKDTFQNSPKNGEAPADFQQCYELHAEDATKRLMKFLSDVLPTKRISVMYFDEAPELGSHLRIFLRLVQRQLSSTKMWYTFMGTKSSISYNAPPDNKFSLRPKPELARLLPPYYIDLGFDQQAIANSRAVSVRMGDMQTIEFISQYGRPMWSAHLPEVILGEMIDLASLKLLNGRNFNDSDKDHVFAVLSQRLCLDPVLAAPEAIGLVERSVAHHMRLLTGFSTGKDRFYMHAPSEPILAMASIDILYNTSRPADRLRQVLDTLSRDLCGAGLIEKGILGELGARTLLLIARDFAAAFSCGQNSPKPILLLYFLHTLFGKDTFIYSEQLNTRDPTPEKLDLELLANLWARGAALQCCYSQESIDLLIPLYHGSISLDSKFDPSRFSVVVVQVKNKVARDKLAIRPVGVTRDRHQPLPYLVILMALGDGSRYGDRDSDIKFVAPEPPADGEFGILCDTWNAAAEKLETYRREKNIQKDTLEDLEKKTNDARLAVNFCNQYSISVRGASPYVYGILGKAKIENEFGTLLRNIMPSPGDERARQHMRPFERLSDGPHTAWMSNYAVPNEDVDAHVDP
ncbi:hypothetical protein F5887DRAFT_1212483 [Amanita rubescens]|nr:hypothetical protein F5887DRAFT_1212483 [Amanita rubescens]